MKRFIFLISICVTLLVGKNLSADSFDEKSIYSIEVSADTIVNVINNIEYILNVPSDSPKKEAIYNIQWLDVDLYDKYYDVPELRLLKSNAQVYQRTILNDYKTTRKGKQKKTNDYIYFIDSKHNSYAYKTKNYNKAKDFWGKHPLLGSVKRSDRKIFSKNLRAVDVNAPLRLKNILNIRSVGKRLVLTNKNKENIVVEILYHSVDSLESIVNYSSIRFYPKDIPDSIDINTKIKDYIEEDQKNNNLLPAMIYNESEYKHAYVKLLGEVYFWEYRITYPVLVKLVYSIISFVIGISIIVLLFRKRMISK